MLSFFTYFFISSTPHINLAYTGANNVTTISKINNALSMIPTDNIFVLCSGLDFTTFPINIFPIPDKA